MQTNQLFSEIEQAIESQKQKLLDIGSKFVSPFTEEDLMQPFDFPELMRDPEFLYEEGVFHGQLQMLTILKGLFSTAVE
ncbi:MAG: hypothetical protein ACOYK9_05345 [Chlamydiia bacterium]